MVQEFHGAKAAVFIGAELLIYQRDDTPGLPYRGLWDFPGGGSEGAESPYACLRREVEEEFGLDLDRAEVLAHWPIAALRDDAAGVWFFVVQFPAGTEAAIRFGEEGQCWTLAAPGDVLKMPDLVPTMRDRLKLWLRDGGGNSI